MEGVLAVITTWATDFAPKGWAYCNGQLLPIAQNQALFSLLGTTFGGNGVNTFALPNMQSRTAVGTGQGVNGAPNITLGEMTGSETTTLTIANLPSHVHNGPVNVTPRGGTSGDTTDSFDGYPGPITNGYATTPTPNTFLNGPNVISSTIGTSGGGQPVEVLSPYLCLNYIICLQGLFPSRN